MQPTQNEPSLDSLMDQYEDIGGPETFGPNGTAIILAIWRKSRKLGWLPSFTMTNTELHYQTGIKSRDTINTYRDMLVGENIIHYSAPPRGKSKGDYVINVNFSRKAVHKMDNLDDNKGQVVREMDHFSEDVRNPVQNMDNSADTVLRDLKDTITTITTVNLNQPETMNGMIAILNAYCKMHNRLDLHVRPREREAMGKMVAGGMPFPFTIRTMELLLEEKRKREGQNFKLPTSFLYFVEGINEAWRNHQAVEIGQDSLASEVPSLGLANGTQKRTKQQQSFDLLDQIAMEEAHE